MNKVLLLLTLFIFQHISLLGRVDGDVLLELNPSAIEVQDDSHEEDEDPQSNMSPTKFSSRIGGHSSSSGFTIPLFRIPDPTRPLINTLKKLKKPPPPHYVKYWGLNGKSIPVHHHKKKRKHGWKVIKKNPIEPGYFVDLTERVLGCGWDPSGIWEGEE